MLTIERLQVDPLQLNEIDAPTTASGPHLIYLTGPNQTCKVREFVGEKPARVWWVWPDEPNAGAKLYRHLHGLNMIEIPKDRFDTDAPGGDRRKRDIGQLKIVDAEKYLLSRIDIASFWLTDYQNLQPTIIRKIGTPNSD